MLGLSISAIGLRPITECLTIYNTIKNPLNLKFLELAVGSNCRVDLDYKTPLIIHDSCLYKGHNRLDFSLFNKDSWRTYKLFIEGNDVLCFTVHAPLIKEGDKREVEKLLAELQFFLNIPVYVEGMAGKKYWSHSVDTLLDWPMLLDVSHVYIWNKGDALKTRDMCLSLIDKGKVNALHLSHNLGRKDDHLLIPQDVWFNEYIEEWSKVFTVTYESLPEKYSKFKRVDQ